MAIFTQGILRILKTEWRFLNVLYFTDAAGFLNECFVFYRRRRRWRHLSCPDKVRASFKVHLIDNQRLDITAPWSEQPGGEQSTCEPSPWWCNITWLTSLEHLLAVPLVMPDTVSRSSWRRTEVSQFAVPGQETWSFHSADYSGNSPNGQRRVYGQLDRITEL